MEGERGRKECVKQQAYNGAVDLPLMCCIIKPKLRRAAAACMTLETYLNRLRRFFPVMSERKRTGGKTPAG